MVEVLEYTLVFLVSSAMVGFSFVALSSYSGSAQSLGGQAAFSAMTSAAWGAIEHGGGDVSVTLENSTITCSEGQLSFVSQSYSGSVALPVGCSFGFHGLSGSHHLKFSASSSWLEMEVD